MTTGTDYLAKVKTRIGKFVPGGVYWCGTKHIGFDVQYRKRNNIPLEFGASPTADTFPTSLIPPYTDQDKLLIVRGGIGDLLALSILHDAAPEVIVLTTKSLFPLMEWWETTPKLKHFNEPLFMLHYPERLADKAKTLGQTAGDHIITAGSRENWYDITARSVGKAGLPGRPQLKQDMRPRYMDRLGPESILIVNKATSINRTAELAPILMAIQGSGQDVYFYDDERRLTWYGEKKWPNPTPLEQYLADLYYAGFVISVDTSAIHFREGIAKPALGLYSSFTTESRTRDYKYTHSIDVKSACSLAPCFINFEKCPVIQSLEKDGMPINHAPCLGSDNELLIEQIKAGMETALIKAFRKDQSDTIAKLI